MAISIPAHLPFLALSQYLSLIGAKGPNSMCGRWNLARGMSDEEGDRGNKGWVRSLL